MPKRPESNGKCGFRHYGIASLPGPPQRPDRRHLVGQFGVRINPERQPNVAVPSQRLCDFRPNAGALPSSARKTSPHRPISEVFFSPPWPSVRFSSVVVTARFDGLVGNE